MGDFVYLNRETGDRVVLDDISRRLERIERWHRIDPGARPRSGANLDSVAEMLSELGPEDVPDLEMLAEAILVRLRELAGLNPTPVELSEPSPACAVPGPAETPAPAPRKRRPGRAKAVTVTDGGDR